ncbi:glycosyl transferase [Opitutaceae bacterium TAV5]|nr:glycosyl transferase [Opitutaceae bacterium TAV5]
MSVLIAAWQAAPTLARALASVRAQTHRDWELVVVEDGSRDGTEALVRAFAAEVSQPVRYDNPGVNQGVAAARNRLLRLAAGDALAFLDADDEWTPDHLRLAAARLAAGADLVAAGVSTFDLATGAPLGDVLPPAALESDPVGTLFRASVIVTSSCVVFTRDLLRRTGDFDLRFRIGEDRDYWLRAGHAGARLAIEPALTCRYAKHPGSAMARTLAVAEQTVRFYEKHARLTAVPVALRRRLLARSLATEARLLRATDPRASARLLWRAWRLAPADPALPAHLVFSALRAVVSRPSPRVLLVADLLGGQCRRSGIHQLARVLSGHPAVRVIATPDTRPRRALGKLWSMLHHWPARNQSQTFTELETDWALATARLAAAHFLVGEYHAPYLSRRPGKQAVIATLHMPASALDAPPPRTGRVHTLVLLSSRERDFFAGAWGARQTVVIPHGVDTDFFRPGAGPDPARPSILVVGRTLRDFALTGAAVLRLAARHPRWRFDFVVPASVWHGVELAAVRTLRGVCWHDRIDDETLRLLYQTATCHLTPFRDCTANNALVESLACGLPPVTNDRGGVRDYGAGVVYPLARDNSVAALMELCERHAAEPAWRSGIAAACRAFALDTLSWPVIARRHLELYAQVSRLS